MMHIIFRTIAVVALFGLTGSAGFAAEPSSPVTQPEQGARVRDPLAAKQQIIRDRMTQLEDRMFRLTEKLGKTEPEQAKRLLAALQQARESLIRHHMEETIALLEQGKFSDASDREHAIVQELEGVLKLLIEDPDRSDERQQEIDRLKELQEQVRAVLELQRNLKQRADAAPRLEQLLAGIRAAIAQIESLMEREQRQMEQTSAARAEEADAAAKLREAQRQIRVDTESLAEILKDPLGGGLPDPGESQQNGSPPESQPANSASGTTPGARQPRSTRPAGTPPSSTMPAGAEQAEPTEQDVQSGLRKAGSDVSRAGQQMKSAEDKLGQAPPAESVPAQKESVESLRRALQELRTQEANARRQLDQAEAARRQKELHQRTEKLAGDMQGGQKAGSGQQSQQGSQGNQDQQGNKGQQGQQDAQQSQNGQQPPAPGAQNVQDAGKHMEEAADDLDKENPAEASKDQQQAIEQLEQAQRDLEQALEQQRREQQEEILRGLESRFRGMLSKQLAVNKSTDALVAKGAAAWVHADELSIASLSQDETKLSEEASQALLILKEEGTTIVFPRMVTQMQQDMQEVARRLGAKTLDPLTLHLERDIADTLKELIGAIEQLRKDLKENQGGGGGGGSSPGNEPLLPDSAELKLLRSCQERVNHLTQEFANRLQDETPLNGESRASLVKIAERQREVADMARKMNERITGQ